MPHVPLVRVLEARFHPGSKSGQGVVVVARVFCEGRTARIEPVRVGGRLKQTVPEI